MKRVFILLMLFFAPFARAADIYFAQTSAGANNGTSCANAYAYNDALHGWNVAANYVAGNTLHFCGAFVFPGGQTTVLTTAGSGSSGNPITLKLETGASLSAPYWGAVAIHVVNNFITVDGGTNGVIQATANGTGLANQNTAGGCLRADAADNFTLQNLTCANIYVHTCSPPTPVTGCTDTNASTNGILIADSNNTLIQNNTIHDVHWGIVEFASTRTVSGWEYKGNNIYNVDHGVVPNVGSAQTASNIWIHNNLIHDFQSWDDAANNNHHDAVHAYAVTSGVMSGLYVYNNHLYGDWGQHTNAGIFLELGDQGGSSSGQCAAFNNIVDPSNGGTAAGVLQDWSTQGCLDENNTFLNNNNFYGGLNVQYTNAAQPGPTWYNNIVVANGQNCPGCGSWMGQGTVTGKLAASDYNAFALFNTPTTGNGFHIPGSGCCQNYTGWSGTFDSHAVLSGSGGSGPQSGLGINVSTYVPNSGSPLIGAGKNLNATCTGQPIPGLGALCFDYNGAARPTSANWDIGAVNGSSVTGSMSVTSITFPGTTNVGSTSAQQVATVTNTGSAAITLSTPYFTVTGTNPGDFTNVVPGSGTPCANGASLAVSGACTLAFTMTPSAAGTRSATMNINGTLTANGSAVGTTGSLTGTGVNPIPAGASGLPKGLFAFRPGCVLSICIGCALSNTGAIVPASSIPIGSDYWTVLCP